MADIAMVGMACLFPGAQDLQTYWANILSGVDAITEVPEARWPAEYYDEHSSRVDRFYCRHGGFIDELAYVDPLALGVMPNAVDSMEPDQLLALKVGMAALADAGCHAGTFNQDKAGVIIGRGNYVGSGMLRLEQHVRLVPQIMTTLAECFPQMDAKVRTGIEEKLHAQLTYYGPDVAAGLIPNLMASRLAHKLDWHGPAYTVDAACASSLLAVEQACDALKHGMADLMLVGGVHVTHDLTFWATFCQLGALSRHGKIRPLSAAADGLLAGEGLGMVVLKRLADAEAAGDRIYAVIEGVGSSSDGRHGSLLAPSVEGQMLALQRAWSQTGRARHALGLMEAHGTGTPAGDAAELTTLARFFGTGDSGPDMVVGSVKSMIGHTMPAAGMAGLIKAALSVYHGQLPPTLHCEKPHPLLASTRFKTLSHAEDWALPAKERIAAVNAFGFGGINTHVVIRGQDEAVTGLADVWLLSASSPEELLQRLDRGERDGLLHARGPCRLALLAQDARTLATARKVILGAKPWHGRQHVFFSPHGLLQNGAKPVFVFPGVDSRFAPRTEGLATWLGRPLPAYCHELDPSRELLPVVVGLLGFNRYMADCLHKMGVEPAAVAGHSVGEWSAMLASGMLDQSLSDQANATLDFSAVQFPDVFFLAASCDVETLTACMHGLKGIDISHDNCPHQVIACGQREAIDVLMQRLSELGIMFQKLPFVSGFHSSLFSDYMGWYRDFFGQAELSDPAWPVWSATLCQPFPEDLEARRHLALEHLLRPVRFREMIEAMYAEGHRVFIQVGTGSLTGFIQDILGQRPHSVISANHDTRTGLAQLQQMAAALWVQGMAVGQTLLTSGTASRDGRRLELGVPLLHLDTPVAHSGIDTDWNIPEGDLIGQAMSTVYQEMRQSCAEVLSLWQHHQQRTRWSLGQRHVFKRKLDVDTTIPWVMDHTLYPQRPGWPSRIDRHPVVPMTMELAMVEDAVTSLWPDLMIAEVHDIEAYNWLVVAHPVEVVLSLEVLAEGRIAVEIEGYFRAIVVVADHYQYSRVACEPLINPRPARVPAHELYHEGWMFHGPAYQGLTRFHAWGENGIDASIHVPEGQGALLDNMGQAAGYWVMEQPDNCLAMPVGIDRVRYFSARPHPGDQGEVQVRVRELDENHCKSDLVYSDTSGHVLIEIQGWHTRRYAMDKAFWEASRQLHRTGVSQEIGQGMVLFQDRYDTAILREYMARRYLNEPELMEYESLQPRRRRQWLNGRIAAKDAVRLWLRENVCEELYPKEIRVLTDTQGAPKIQLWGRPSLDFPLYVSLAHKHHLALAKASRQAVGVDLEWIESRDEGFMNLAFSAEELLGLSVDSAEQITRAWVAKESVAKALGTGLGGRPKDFCLTEIQGEDFWVNPCWVRTQRYGNYILGYTLVGADPEGQGVYSESNQLICE